MTASITVVRDIPTAPDSAGLPTGEYEVQIDAVAGLYVANPDGALVYVLRGNPSVIVHEGHRSDEGADDLYGEY